MREGEVPVHLSAVTYIKNVKESRKRPGVSQRVPGDLGS